VEAAGLEAVPDGVRVPAGRAEATVRFRLAGAAPQGDETLLPGSLTLRGPGVVWRSSVGPGVAVTPADGGVRFESADGGVARWRVESVGAVGVIPDAATYAAGLDWRFARASLPEPAVPMGLRGRRDRGTLFWEIVSEVRVPTDGVLPGTDPVHPRQLNAAWRSGWVTPVERGLILHRFLGQEKFKDAAWALTGEHADPVSLTGFDTVLVNATVDGARVWVDPTCTVCAPGEIGTRWLGRPAIGAVAEIPTAPGRLDRALSLDGDHFRATFQATGAAALWLRERIAGVEPAVRPARIAAVLGFPGGTLANATGFEVAGGPITLELLGSEPPKDPFPTAATPWDGGWGDSLAP
jgi:hypothetical protein